MLVIVPPQNEELRTRVLQAMAGNRVDLNRLMRDLMPIWDRRLRAMVTNTEDREDLVAALAAHVSVSIHRLYRPEALRKYSEWSLQRMVSDYIRKSKRTPAIVSLDSEHIDNYGTTASVKEAMHLELPLEYRAPHEVFIARQRQEVLWNAIATLPEAQRTVLILFYWFGYSMEEIARLLRCKLGTVKSRLSRARSSLRSQLPRALADY